jgi:uncharacterized phage protein gp47/JayE
MSLFDDLLQNETMASVRTRIVGYAQAANLVITSWVVGDPGEQIVAAMSLAAYTAARAITATIRGYASLDSSVDPGDADPFDPTNEDLDDAPGALSNMGANWYSTPRREATFASGFAEFVNGGTTVRTFAPEALTWTWTGGTPPAPAPTYRNAAEPTIYTNPDGTVTVAAGATVTLPITAEEIGTRSNAPPTTLSLTTVLSGVTATNPAAVTGTDREDAETYRARCRKAPSRLSLGGPNGAYEYLAQANLDGTPLQNASENDVNITRAQVSKDSATGNVNAFFASPSGAATAEDVTAANTNIEVDSFAVPDAITYTGQAATEVVLAVAGTAKLRNTSGVDVDAAKAAIVAALTAAFAKYPIGGVDQVLGAGVLYTHDFQAVAAAAYPGLYDLLVTTPAGTSTALAQGDVGVLSTAVVDWTVTLV